MLVEQMLLVLDAAVERLGALGADERHAPVHVLHVTKHVRLCATNDDYTKHSMILSMSAELLTPLCSHWEY